LRSVLRFASGFQPTRPRGKDLGCAKPASTSCSCLRLLVASNRPHKGLSPSIIHPCPTHVYGRGYAPPSDTPRGLFPISLMSTGTETGRGSRRIGCFQQRIIGEAQVGEHFRRRGLRLFLGSDTDHSRLLSRWEPRAAIGTVQAKRGRGGAGNTTNRTFRVSPSNSAIGSVPQSPAKGTDTEQRRRLADLRFLPWFRVSNYC
jgi:hypothetical protein